MSNLTKSMAARIAELKARIAELEAERDTWQQLAHLRGDHSVERAKTAIARIAELEAEAEVEKNVLADVTDKWRVANARIAELEAALASYDAGKSDRELLAQERIAELEAELLPAGWLKDKARIAELEAEGTRLNTALAEWQQVSGWRSPAAVLSHYGLSMDNLTLTDRLIDTPTDKARTA